MKLLIATDDLDLARALGAALVSGGVAVEHCLDPDDVLGRSWRALPDVIMVDLDLPLASGFSLLRQLQDDGFCRDIPVVVTSAVLDHLSDDVALCWEQLSAEAFLPRPFSMLDIPELLHEIATSGWSIEDDEGLPTLERGPIYKAAAPDRAPEPTGPISLGELRTRRLDAQRAHRRVALTSPVPVQARTVDPCRVSARDLHRELDALRLAPPRRVLGLSAEARRTDIRYAAIRKRDRPERLRDDVDLVPEVRVAAQRLLELVTTAEACLLGRLI